MLDFFKNGRGEILKLFFSDPEKEYYLREIARILGKVPGYYQRNLSEFVKNGILHDRRQGNMRFFELNKNHPLYEELKSITSKTIGLEYKLKDLFVSFNEIIYAFIFGSMADGRENSASDIDLLLIGEADQDILIKKINLLEKEINREINYHLYKKTEVLDKIKNKETFFINIFTLPLIALKGSYYEFTKLVKQ